ncbi:MAG: hypothetical protein HOD92_10740 [Deltaproteobacteria bacterium]|nr:hypothetical protein [Deltaproteobacteria bacterium]
MTNKKELVSVFSPMEGSALYSSSLGNILIGCPPEILKALLKYHLPMPDTIVIPGTLYKNASSQACLEFPFYHFLFIQQGLARGKKLKVYAEKSTCVKLVDMLRVTLLGPNEKEALEVEEKFNVPKESDKQKIKQIINETRYLALKKKNGDIYSIDDMIEFIPLKVGDKEPVYPAFEDHPEITIHRTDKNDFTIECEKKYECSDNINKVQSPAYRIKATKITPEELKKKNTFSVRCLGASEGFDPTQPSNGFLFRMNGKWVLWDCPAYLHLHLKAIGISYQDIDAIFMSHIHEDHLDIMQSVRKNKKSDLYTTPEIFHCMILKLMTVLNCSYTKATSYYNFNPIYANRPFELFKSTFEVFYSVHSIPALGLRLSVPKKNGTSKFFLSGDNMSKRVIQKMDEDKVFTKKRKKEVENFLPDNAKFDAAFVDAGSGMIHGDPQDYFNNEGVVYYMHTGKSIENIPKNHQLLKSGMKVNIH